MPKALFALCALGAASLLSPIAAYGAPAIRPVTVGVTESCSSAHPDTNAAVLFAAPVDVPAIAQEMGFKGSTSIQIELAPSGKLVAASVAQTSGSRMVDASALSAAKQSTFRAGTINCEPVGGVYLLLADLTQ